MSKIFLFANKHNWYRYKKPTWLNTVTFKEAGVKIYRWLIFGWTEPI